MLYVDAMPSHQGRLQLVQHHYVYKTKNECVYIERFKGVQSHPFLVSKERWVVQCKPADDLIN